MTERTYKDSSGKTLADYPRPSVAVDTALLTLDGDRGLVVLEVRRIARVWCGVCSKTGKRMQAPLLSALARQREVPQWFRNDFMALLNLCSFFMFKVPTTYFLVQRNVNEAKFPAFLSRVFDAILRKESELCHASSQPIVIGDKIEDEIG